MIGALHPQKKSSTSKTPTLSCASRRARRVRPVHVSSVSLSVQPYSTPSSQAPRQPRHPAHVRKAGIHTLKSQLMLDEVHKKFSELSQYLPSRDHPEYSTRRNWITHILTHKYTVLPDFVAQLGRSVHLIDVRSEEDILGPVGYIRGANWFPKSDIDKITSSFPKDGLIAVVCANDGDSRDVVRALKHTGHNLSAIVAGGMRSWKLMGFSSSRDPSILSRRSVPVSVQSQERRQAESPLKPGETITMNQVISHLGTGDTIQWIKLAAFLTHGRMSCIDGRDDSGIIGTPGGDMGEFILHLATAEQLLGRPLQTAEVASLFQRRLDAFGRFYMHTDQASADKLLERLTREVDDRIGPLIKDLPPDFAIHIILQNVTKESIDKVLDILSLPEIVGCGHLRNLLLESEKYRVRKDLVRASIQCFFRARWEGATECDYVVLSGDHAECGVANVNLSKPIHSFTKIPLISPSISHHQLFVNHGQISQYLRHQQCEWFIEQTDVIKMSPIAIAAFPALVDLLAEHHSNLTVTKLAKGLPVFALEFGGDHSGCKIKYQGVVGEAPPVDAVGTAPASSAETQLGKTASNHPAQPSAQSSAQWEFPKASSQPQVHRSLAFGEHSPNTTCCNH